MPFIPGPSVSALRPCPFVKPILVLAVNRLDRVSLFCKGGDQSIRRELLVVLRPGQSSRKEANHHCEYSSTFANGSHESSHLVELFDVVRLTRLRKSLE